MIRRAIIRAALTQCIVTTLIMWLAWLTAQFNTDLRLIWALVLPLSVLAGLACALSILARGMVLSFLKTRRARGYEALATGGFLLAISLALWAVIWVLKPSLAILRYGV